MEFFFIFFIFFYNQEKYLRHKKNIYIHINFVQHERNDDTSGSSTG